MNNRLIVVLSVLALTPFLVGCQSGAAGSSKNMEVSDNLDRGADRAEAELTISDQETLAENVTNEFLSSDLAEQWANQDGKAQVVVGDLRNNTDNENIQMKYFNDRILEVLQTSDLVDVYTSPRMVKDFNYIINSELTNTRQYYDDGREFVEYTFQFNVMTPRGKLEGKYSDNMRLKG